MRRIAAISLSLILAACAASPRTVPSAPPPGPPSAHTRGAIIGLTATELIQRLGAPALQVREGESVKLQFRNQRCVLDAYLYPSGSAPYRVTYVDARTPMLADIDPLLCIDSLEAP